VCLVDQSSLGELQHLRLQQHLLSLGSRGLRRLDLGQLPRERKQARTRARPLAQVLQSLVMAAARRNDSGHSGGKFAFTLHTHTRGPESSGEHIFVQVGEELHTECGRELASRSANPPAATFAILAVHDRGQARAPPMEELQ